MRSGRMITILLLEDAPLWAEDIQEELSAFFADKGGATIALMEAEAQFMTWLESAIPDAYPDVFVLDIMIPWMQLGTELPTEDAPQERNYFEGGIRCYRALRAKGIDKPVIFHSVLDKEDLPKDIFLSPNTHFTPKTHFIEKSGSIGPLARKIVESLST